MSKIKLDKNGKILLLEYRVQYLEKLLSEMDKYLDTNELTSIGSTSNFHRQIKDALSK